jgi:hypothetical protein
MFREKFALLRRQDGVNLGYRLRHVTKEWHQFVHFLFHQCVEFGCVERRALPLGVVRIAKGVTRTF